MLNSAQGLSGHQIFLAMPNLRSKIFFEFFPLKSALSEIFRGGSGPTFFDHVKFETKNFFGIFLLYRVL